jgi:hypothetical protein
VPGSLDRPGQPPVPDQSDAIEAPGRLRSASSRPDLPEILDRADQRQLADGGRWSKADLRQRLEQLPPGHPSSLRSDDPKSSQARDLRQPEDGGNSRCEADAIKQNYWSEVPRFLRAWADHVRRWPAERLAAVVDRGRDPAGSWRGDGNQYLDPEQHAQSNHEIENVKRREETITKGIEETARDKNYGGWLEGLAFRCKGDERLKEKIAEKIQAEPDRTPVEAIKEINDAIRYTFCFEPSNYANGYWDFRQRLESSGYRMIYNKNHWRDDPEYKGTNTRWVTPDGQRFEVQFHTPESYHAKQQVTHNAYERTRNPLTGRRERREIEVFQREVYMFITVPNEIDNIPDYKEEDN